MQVETTEENALSILSMKRKADEAFDALDDALQVRPKEIRPSPVKKPSVSFYSSLIKHGIATKEAKTLVSTPTLSALLNRARSKKKIKSSPIVQQVKISAVTPEYSPGSTDAFLERMSTFNLSRYPSKPQPIDAVAAAMAGWINEGGKNRLTCLICHAGWVVTDRDGLSKETADALVEKQAELLISNHKEGCPWRTRQCDPIVYRIPLQSPATMAKQLKEQADKLNPLMGTITVRHPLSTNQVTSLVKAVTAVASKPSPPPPAPFESSSDRTNSIPEVRIPSTTALLTALFGWTLVSLPAPTVVRKQSAVSLAQARNQSLSRAGSAVNSTSSSRATTPAPTANPGTSSPPSTPVNSQYRSTSSAFPSTPSDVAVKFTISNAMLQCKMCQRRVGLWFFATSVEAESPVAASQANGASTLVPHSRQRQLDLIREHRSYCPYVVKSTPLAALPFYGSTTHPENRVQTGTPPFALTRADTFTGSSTAEQSVGGFQKPALFRSATTFLTGRNISHNRSNSVPSTLQNLPLVEGWRAVYNTILRYGISERISSGSGLNQNVDNAEADEDDAMQGVTKIVEEVKRHGGKQVLAYVRNLLG